MRSDNAEVFPSRPSPGEPVGRAARGGAGGRAASRPRHAFVDALESRRLLSATVGLVNGGVVNGATTSANEVDSFAFQAAAGAQVQLATVQSSTPNYVAKFTLTDGAGRQVDTWLGKSTRAPRTLAGGNYLLTVIAQNKTATGTYSVGLEGISPVSPGSTPLVPGGVVNGTISDPLDVKEYTFDAAPGAILQLATVQSSTPNFVAQFTIYDATGRQVDTWLGKSTRAPRTFTAGGRYLLKVSAQNYTATGTFSIGLEGIAPVSPGSASLVNGGVVDGSIAAPLDVKEYLFDAAPGAIVQLATVQSSTPNFVAQFTLYDATGKQVDTWLGKSTRAPRTLAGGRYLLKVTAQNYTATGTYSIGLEGITPISPNPLSLVPGGVVSGSISAELDVKEYVFNATAGAVIQLATVQSSTANFVAQFTVYDAAGRQVDTWLGKSTRAPRTFAAAGRYLVKVTAQNYTATGTFSIGLEGIAPVSPGPLALKAGTVANGSIAAPLDVKEYVFSAAAGAKVSLSTVQSSTPNFVAQFTLYDATGKQLDTWLGKSSRAPRTLAGGQYLVKVTAQNYTATGTFGIRLD